MVPSMDATIRREAISLVIPAFNEANAIAQALEEAEASLSPHFEQFEILIVDDGSLDKTTEVVEGLLPFSPHTRLIRHGVNRGYGAALERPP